MVPACPRSIYLTELPSCWANQLPPTAVDPPNPPAMMGTSAHPGLEMPNHVAYRVRARIAPQQFLKHSPIIAMASPNQIVPPQGSSPRFDPIDFPVDHREGSLFARHHPLQKTLPASFLTDRD
jgi:hypothetical protein